MATLEEMHEITEQVLDEEKKYSHRIHVCAGPGCVSSEELIENLRAEVEARGLKDKILVKQVGCLRLCAKGPIVLIKPEEMMYHSVKPEDAAEIIDALDKKPVKRLLLDQDIPFFKRQHLNVLKNSGIVDPEKIDDYIARGGYRALYKVLTEMDPQEVVKEVVQSGLRGRGGGGYPTGLKWSTVAKTITADCKYVICNADEGDPGAFMDRSVLEGNPHLVLEGMAIAAYAVGAPRGYVYVRAEYPLAIKRLRIAIRQAEKMGLLGHRICGTPLDFQIDLRVGAGAFVCGEETALINSIQGNRGMPRPRPPYPAQSGLWGCSTLINNVETFANVPSIINTGADEYAKVGTEKSKGTKVFALAGEINNTGLIEVPMGITLREIVFDIGGGISGGKNFKAVQTGGPAGGCIPEEYLDTPVDYESLARLGSIMGSGGIIVIDDSSSMIEFAKYFMEFSMDESCGKCVPCRVGTAQIAGLLQKFIDGTATQWDLSTLAHLCELVQNTSLCGLGQAAPNPVLSTMKYFHDEYIAQMQDETGAVAEALEEVN